MPGAFSQLTVLGSSLVLLLGLTLLWRRGISAYIVAFRWQSFVLAAVTGVVAYFGRAPELYWAGALLLFIKGLAIPRLLENMERKFGASREAQPYLNTATSLLVAGVLVVIAYVVTRPLVAVTQLPTRAGMPLAMGLVFVS